MVPGADTFCGFNLLRTDFCWKWSLIRGSLSDTKGVQLKTQDSRILLALRKCSSYNLQARKKGFVGSRGLLGRRESRHFRDSRESPPSV